MDFILPKEIICINDFNGYRRLLPLDDPSREDDTDYIKLYNEKFNIIKEREVLSIFEIGVRAGYSAYTFKTAFPDARYVGMDADNCTHGGAGGPWTWSAKIMMDKYFKNWTILNIDTQKLKTIPYGGYDFAHVDGDHTSDGCYHDMSIVWPEINDNGRMVIDDYTHLPQVKDGVDRWLRDNLGKYFRFEFKNTVRGDIVIYK